MFSYLILVVYQSSVFNSNDWFLDHNYLFIHQNCLGQQCRKSFPARAWSGANHVIQKQNCDKGALVSLQLHDGIKLVSSWRQASQNVFICSQMYFWVWMTVYFQTLCYEIWTAEIFGIINKVIVKFCFLISWFRNSISRSYFLWVADLILTFLAARAALYLYG